MQSSVHILCNATHLPIDILNNNSIRELPLRDLGYYGSPMEDYIQEEENGRLRLCAAFFVRLGAFESICIDGCSVRAERSQQQQHKRGENIKK